MIRIVDSLPPAPSPSGQPGSYEPFRMIVESLHEAVWLAGPDNAKTLYVNPAYEAVWGRSCASLYDSPTSWLEIVHDDDREQARRAAAAAAGEKPYECEYRIARPDGAMRRIRHRGFPVPSSELQERCYACIAEDVTDFKDARAASYNASDRYLYGETLALRVLQQSSIAEFGARALACADLQQLMTDAANVVAETLRLDYVGILELQSDASHFLLRAGCGWEPGMVGEVQVSAQADTLAGYMLSTSEPVIVADLRRESRFRDSFLLRERDVVSALGCMIPNRDRPYGVLGAFSKQSRTFTEDDVHFLQGIAHILAAAVERREAQQELDRFFSPAMNPMFIGGFDGYVKRVNHAGEIVLGFSAAEIMAAPMLNLVHPDDRATASAELLKLAAGGTTAAIEFRLLCRDGSYKWTHWSATPFADQGVFYAVGYDVSDRRAAEIALAEREEEIRTLLDSLAEGVFGIDLDGKCTFANAACRRLLGYDAPEDLLGKTMHDVMHHSYPDGTPMPREECQVCRSSRENREAHVSDEVLWRRDGTSFPVEYFSHPIYKDGKVAGCVVSFLDISRRVKAAMERDRFFNHPLTPMCILGFDGRFKNMNPACGGMFGYSPDELLEQPFLDAVHPEDRERAAAEVQAIATGDGSLQYEIRIRCKDGSYKWTSWNAVAFDDQRAFYAVGHDVTDRRIAEESLAERARQQQAVAELGGRALHGGDLGPLFDEAAAILARTLRAEFATFMELLPGGREFLLKAGCGWEPELIGQATMPIDPQFLCGYMLTSGEPVVVEDVTAEARFRAHPLAVAHGFKGEMACLVQGRLQPHGVLCVHCLQQRRFTEDDIHFMQSVANILAAAIERRRAEEELDRFFEPSLNPMYVGGFDGIIKRCNRALEMLTGYTRQELMSRPLWLIIHHDDRRALFVEAKRLMAGDSTLALELRILCKDGSYRWTLWNAASFLDSQNFYATGQDVTDRHLAEEALRRQANLLNLTHDAIIVRDLQDRITFWNFGAEERYGWTAAEALGQVTHRLLQTQFPQPRDEILRELHAAGRWEGELVHATRDGRMIFVASRWSLERDGRGTPTGILEINNDVTERKMAEDALRASEETLRATGESALDAIVRLDAEGNVAQWNAAAERMFGFGGEEILGRNLHEVLVPAESRERYLQGWPQFRESGQGLVIGKVLELEALRKDGSRFPVEVSVSAVSLHERWNAVGIIRDITQRKRAEADLVAAKSAAETANRSKSEFLANMSHEIRTPMNGVIGLTSLVLDTELSKEQRQYLDGVMLSAEALLKIINDILDFSKIEAGRLELEKLEFDLRETLENTIRTLAVRAHEKGLELLCDVFPEAPDALVGDPARLWQVLVNLVGNAIKFTQEGEVSVTVGVESLSGEEVSLLFTVSDTGIGIPADKAQALFRPFSQVDSSMTRKYGGTGLGLAISAQIVELMKGRIWFESELGQGSKFHFTASFGLRTTTLPKRAPLPPSGLDGLRVLMVDDNATNRMILRNMLTHWGMRPAEAEGGNVALQLLRNAHRASEPFGLILLDVMMPVMDGFEVLERIRQMPEISRPVIMMLSSRDEPGDAARARELGAAAYIVKPIRPSDLLDAIVSTLGISLEAPSASAPAAPAAGAEPRGPSLRVLVAEDNPINQMLAVRVLEKAGHSVAVADNGEEVLIAVGREAFDLVLMDVQMPVMDGFEATALIRQQEKATGRRLPIVAMTAHAMKGDREKCLEAGMDGYVAKPIQREELFAAIAAAIPSKTPAAFV